MRNGPAAVSRDRSLKLLSDSEHASGWGELRAVCTFSLQLRGPITFTKSLRAQNCEIADFGRKSHVESDPNLLKFETGSIVDFRKYTRGL
jgi:hypothetical protein